MIHRISSEQVKLGMYICRFGGSWLEHPFWRKRLLLATAADVDAVRRSGVPYVEIDDTLGIGPAKSFASASFQLPQIETQYLAGAKVSARLREEYEQLPPENPRLVERKRAVEVVNRSTKVMRRVFESARLGRAIRTAEVEDVVADITLAVSRNMRTLLSVIRLKRKDDYTYCHSVAVCTLMIRCARHLGLPDDQVRELGFAGLLHDIGKMGVPEEVLNKPGPLTDDEFDVVRSHPSFGHGLLEGAGDMPGMALDVCLHHHEKVDGTGYPFGLKGEELSLAARLGAICDVYDALTSDRSYKPGWNPDEAVEAMWGWEGHFDHQLLFSFMQCIGVFPTGMLVRLRSNRLGVVVENRRRASRPRAYAFYDTRAKAFVRPELVTVREDLSGDQIVAPERPEDWGFEDWSAMSGRLMRGMGAEEAVN